MTTHERMTRTYAHLETDRVPIHDGPWAGTLRRWHAEGMPEGDWRDALGVDKVEAIFVDVSPQYPVETLEENERSFVQTTSWGATMRHLKSLDSTPEFLGARVTTPDAWREAKARLAVSDDRIPFEHLAQEYPKWRADGRWFEAVLIFGFDLTHAGITGTENLLIAMLEEPEWVREMFDTLLDTSIALYDRVWDAGYHFDGVMWPDDMGYKGTQFFSLPIYRDLLKPVHARAVEWAHSKGAKVRLHSCGDIRPFVPELVEIGIDALNPLEIKAGMDPFALKKAFGDRLVLHGGIDAQRMKEEEWVMAEIDRLVPVLKDKGGYIFASDHSIPSDVPYATMQRILQHVKEL
jgi:uroporphyrinogen decarboxylase